MTSHNFEGLQVGAGVGGSGVRGGGLLQPGAVVLTLQWAATAEQSFTILPFGIRQSSVLLLEQVPLWEKASKLFHSTLTIQCKTLQKAIPLIILESNERHLHTTLSFCVVSKFTKWQVNDKDHSTEWDEGIYFWDFHIHIDTSSGDGNAIFGETRRDPVIVEPNL